MKNRWIAGVLAFAAFTGLMTGCGKKDTVSEAETAETTAAAAAETTGNSFIITLYPDVAPITCENFENLVSQGFYNGLTFHRVVDGFMAQGGDPQGTGMGGSDQTIKGEFQVNGVENTLSHQRGVVSMARSMDYDSASSQFFICYADCSSLDGSYAAFGEVTEGMEVVDDFLKVERVMGGDGAISSPTKPIVMDSVQMIEDDADGHPRVQVTMNDFLN
ncbi:MAG: peptidylprolyl isomerase [Oscillospiraceae bacterium]|nr:peptidylprolyl isomerase [Oscillospiraceae bacterium]